MTVNINTKELIELLDTTPASQNIMLSGKHGIGKSQILTAYFEKKRMKVVSLFLGQMSDPGDLLGLPYKDEASGKTNFMPPYWFPIDDTPIVLFLDELNRARPEILQTIMDLALNRKLAGRTLPEGSRIISAVNDGEEYQLTDLDPALVSRFNIYNFKPTAGEWIKWALEKGLNQKVISFIEANSHYLDNDKARYSEQSSLEKKPDRRAWEKVSDIIDVNPSVSTKVLSGVIGVDAALAFYNFSLQSIDPKEVLTDFDANKALLEKCPIHELSILNTSIFSCLESKTQPKDTKENIAKYLTWLSGERREAMAHFCSLYERGDYKNAYVFLTVLNPECAKMIKNFMKSI